MHDGGVPREASFLKLLSEFEPGLRRLCAVYATTAADRDDLFQDICFALWRALPNFRGGASVRTYVYRIAHNRGVSSRMRRSPGLHDDVALESLHSTTEGPEDSADRRLRADALYAAVRSLPPLQQQAVALSLEGLNYADIAQVLGLTETNVGVILHRARKQLREVLAPLKEG